MNSDHGTSAVFRLCDEYLTEWAALDPVAAGMRGLSTAFGAATDYSPDGHAARAELIGRTVHATEALLVRARRAFRSQYPQPEGGVS